MGCQCELVSAHPMAPRLAFLHPADHGAPDVRELQRCLAEARALRETLAAPRAILRDARQSLEDKSARLLQHVEECSSPAGKAELAELRRSSRQERAELQAAIGAAAGGLPLEEDRCYEWLRMLKEDKPAKAALLAAEAECDYWEDQLHEHLLMALRWKPPREGLERLDAELQDLTLEERMRTASCAKCFEALARDYPQQPFSELQEAYAMLEDFRQSNDLLAATQAAAQWKEHSIQDGKVKPRRSPDRSIAPKVDESYLPPGPRFFSVAQLLQPPQDPVEPALRMPKAVVSRSEWFAPSTPQVQPSGVSFLSGLTTRRIQPSETGSLSWGRPYFEPTMFSSGDGFDPFASFTSKAPTSADVLRRAFEEPLSEALGRRTTSTSSKRSKRKVPSSLERPPRSGWVTFEAPTTSPPFSERFASFAHQVAAAPDPPWENSDEPAQWEVAWPDTEAQSGDLDFGWSSWEQRQQSESIQLSD
ncbi:unnamed protein product [Durusdinium trenchii]|uniref:Uncharacterized protein n=1 Tax=Durusdinium trenchii TaxID=1381693 RepID=A0ABP0LVI8_9DINO